MRSANNILQLFTAILCFIPLLSSAQTTVIRAGKLIDPATGTTLENQIIIIKGTKIEAVGDNLSIPQDAQLVDRIIFADGVVAEGRQDECRVLSCKPEDPRTHMPSLMLAYPP